MSDGDSDSCDDQHMGRRVLIVDDHPSSRRFATKLLDGAGFRVVGEAEDGKSALTEVVDFALSWCCWTYCCRT